MSCARERLRRLGNEDGFTLIELMVAMIICVVGIASTLVVFDQSRQMTTVAQKREAATQQAERELERLIARPWAKLAYPAANQLPVRSTKADHPSFQISAGGEYRWNLASNAATAREVLYGQAGGTVENLPTKWSDVGGRASGEVYRYVTEVDDKPNIRRVVIAVTVNGPDAPKSYIRVSTLVTNPSPVL